MKLNSMLTNLLMICCFQGSPGESPCVSGLQTHPEERGNEHFQKHFEVFNLKIPSRTPLLRTACSWEYFFCFGSTRSTSIELSLFFWISVFNWCSFCSFIFFLNFCLLKQRRLQTAEAAGHRHGAGHGNDEALRAPQQVRQRRQPSLRLWIARMQRERFFAFYWFFF